MLKALYIDGLFCQQFHTKHVRNTFDLELKYDLAYALERISTGVNLQT